MPKLVFRLYAKDENFTKNMANAQKRLREQSTLFNNINRDGNRASKTMGIFGKALPVLKLGTFVMAMRQVSNVIGSSINASMDAIETQNMFNVSLGQSAVSTGKAIDKMSELYGLDATNIKNSVGTFGLLARSMSFSSEQAETLSLSTYQLGVDLSSLMNIPIEQVMGDLRSGLLGQSETVYKYGMDVTEASLKTEALAQGITKSVRNMSQGEKMALRYAVMIKTGSIAHGDFAKTIEQPANQVKIFRERMVSLSRAIGSLFMNTLGSVLPYINAFVIVLQRVVASISQLIGVSSIVNENTNNGVGGISTDAETAEENVNNTAKAIKKLKATMLGFDELNIMSSNEDTSSPSGSGSSEASIIPDLNIGSYSSLMDTLPMKANEIADKLYKKLTGAFLNVKGYVSGLFGDISFDSLVGSLGGLWDAIQPFGAEVFSGLDWFLTNILAPLAEFTIEMLIPEFINALAGAIEFLTALLDVFKPLGMWLWEELLLPMGVFVGESLITFLGDTGTKLSELSTWMSDNKELILTMTGIIAGFFGAWKLTELMAFIQMSGGLIGAIQGITTAIGLSTIAKLKDLGQTVALKVMYAGDFLKSIVSGTTAIVKQIAQWAILTGAKVFDTIKTAILTAGTWLMNTAQTALNLVMSLNPIMLIVLAIGALIAILVTLYNKSETFRNFVNGAFDGLKKFASWIGSTFVKIWENLGKVFDKVWNGIKATFISIINFVIRGLNKFINAFLTPFNAIIRGLNKIPSVSISTLSVNIPTIPMLADGGIVDNPTLSMIGEAGAEAVMPLNSNALQKYLAPILGNNKIDATEMYNAFYRALSDIERESESENIYNLYIDGSYDKTVREMRRKNVRSGRVIIPVGGN